MCDDLLTFDAAQIRVPAPDPATIAEAAIALANTDGGLILLPAELTASSLEPALKTASARCRPPIALGAAQPCDLPEGPALAVRVARGARVHALEDGRVLVWAGGSVRELGGEAIRRLISARTNGDFEAEIVPGARPADLDPDLIAEFLHARRRSTGRDWRADADRLLEQIGAVTPGGGISVAGLLLFGRSPERWLPQAGARLQRTIGERTVLDQPVSGPLIRVIEGLWSALQAQLRQSTGETPSDYPAAVVRETLFNAIAHREYRLRQDTVTVRLGTDHLEITSPGGLPGHLTSTQHLLGARSRRNPRLHAVLSQWGAREGAAPGLLGVIMGLDRHGSRPPEIESGAYHVTVRIFSAREDHSRVRPQGAPVSAASTGHPQVSPRQRTILAYVRERGSATLHELRARSSSVPPGALQADLDALVALGLLRRIGTRGTPCYILP